MPLQLLHIEEPGVVQSRLWVMVSSKHEHFAILIVDGAWYSKVLGSGDGLVFAVAALLEPLCFLRSHPHDVNVVVWSNVSGLSVRLNSSIKEEHRVTNVGKGVSRSSTGTVSSLL